MSKDWREYIKNERNKYKELKPISCPAFGGENIYFNHYGFDHILYKNGIPRPKEIVIERLNLLKFVPNILMNTKVVDHEEKRLKNNSHAFFWTIEGNLSNKNIRIILRRLGNEGRLHFLSVMNE